MSEAIADDLAALEALAWQRLGAAVGSHRAAFHTGTVGSLGLDGRTQLRTVVLRAVDATARRLSFHTDRRSPKFAELTDDVRMSWLFYDAPTKTQLRLLAEASLHHLDAVSAAAWAGTTLNSRRAYAGTQPPGTVLEAPGDGLPPEPAATLAETEAWQPNFVVVETRVEQLELLLLDHRGHRRAVFDYGTAPRPGRWLVP